MASDSWPVWRIPATAEAIKKALSTGERRWITFEEGSEGVIELDGRRVVDGRGASINTVTGVGPDDAIEFNEEGGIIVHGEAG